MSEHQQPELSEGAAEVNPFQVLHLLPSAPQELVVEVYWHLVNQLQAAAHDDPSLRSRLNQLNEAYAAVIDPSTRVGSAGQNGEEPGGSEATAARRATLFGRFRRRGTARPSRQRSPWELLHLDRNAPPGVAELAHGFWHVRLRNQWTDSPAMGLEQLEEAYQALRREESNALAEGGDEASAPENSPSKATSGAATEEEPAADESAVDRPAGRTALRHRVARASRRAGARVWRRAVVLSASFGRWAVATSRRAGAQAWRGTVALSASFGRWSVRAATALWEQRPRPAKDRAARVQVRTHTREMRPKAEKPASQPGVGERFAALATARAAPPDWLTKSGASEDGMEVPGDEAETDDEAVRSAPAREPAESETALQPPPYHTAEPPGVLAQLVVESGSAQRVSPVIAERMFSIGTDPTCDIVLAGADRSNVAARIWAQEDRFMLHVMAAAPAVLLNGAAVGWAMLEDGDKLQIDGDVFRFERVAPEGKASEAGPID